MVQIGKSYSVQNPDKCRLYGLPTVIKIVRTTESGALFVGDDNCYYREDGTSITGLHTYDLVKEIWQ